MPVSTVPAVWTALYEVVEALTLQPTLNGQTVTLVKHYGAPINEEGNFVAIGYDEAGDAVRADNEWAALGQQKHEERYSIAGLIRVGSGDRNVAAHVAVAYGALADISEAIADDYTLGGTCRIAHIADHTADVRQGPGSAVLVRFTVNVAARI